MLGVKKKKNEIPLIEGSQDTLRDMMMQASDDIMIETSDQAKAQAIVKLSESDVKKAAVLSDLTELHINYISGLLTVDKWLKKNGVDSIITETAINKLILYRIPLKRKSRKEITEIVKTSDLFQDAGIMGRVKHKLGF